ncbi:MAG: hypothetical protein R3308_07635 [Thiohalobacterales bacterium]|nr:hypothetical protein [Thiohalobacterales bacterium]
MNRILTNARLEHENREFAGTPGVSHQNRGDGFLPAFYDTETGQVEISRFLDGQPAPMHMIDGLPENWVVERDATSRVTAIKHTVISGFVRDGCFYTRSEATEAVLAEIAQRAELHTETT